MPRRKDRHLTSAELALWAHVARSVRPISPQSREDMQALMTELMASEPAGHEMAPASRAPAASLRPQAKKPPSQPLPLKPIVPLERKLRTQLKRGIQPIEGIIDLHGLRQDEAQAALISFLHRRQQQGACLVLVVTGKGGAGATSHHGLQGDERGVLRRMVPHWLHLPSLRPLVASFEEADRRHGGGGALYIRLRRQRELGT